jgi:class 3 adenylate cyclase
MNVRKISDVLSTMISGQSRVSSSSLVYKDCVTSRDEIKSLSSEINDMVTVIRGIVPYISASTLKQAEKGMTSTTRKELTFLFTDIRGFTTLCEGMQPEEVVGILNSYLDLETEIILNNHGDVDKFVGDEMMAFFEGPLKELNACRAAMQIRHAMMEEKERREKDGLPIVSIGIGINSGDVVFGSVGARDRMDFTSIGDTVNLAARLEGANKAYGSKSIITETVYNKIKGKFLCRELDFIAVKGKNEPVRIYELLQEVPRAQPKLVEIKNLFEKGLESYRVRNWAKARVAFQKNVDLYDDAPSKIYLERIEHFSSNPPPRGWDGVFRMMVK